MALTAKYFSLAYDSAAVTKGVALKSTYMSVRLIKESGVFNPKKKSYITNILLNGNCVDPEKRRIYVFYIDTAFNSAWIIEIDIDKKIQTVVYYDKDNKIGFDKNHKIYNARVVHGRLIWTDGKNPIYQMDIERAKRSFKYGIGYNPYYPTVEWDEVTNYVQGQNVSYGKYFYKALQNNFNTRPGTDEMVWAQLCLIEDAYYSMNIENFYFAPMAPRTPPIVEYVSDDNRQINNLKGQLFQIAYRYVYMDWRRSTFSPASLVSLPQSEEAVATGFANTLISLNNKLRITVDMGGEEVRAVEVIGRSSEDPTKWFLIDTIEKFTEEDRLGETSLNIDVEPCYLEIEVMDPVVTTENSLEIDSNCELEIEVMDPTVINTWISCNVSEMEWGALEYGELEGQEAIVTVGGHTNYRVNIIPSWITIEVDGVEVEQGQYVDSGETLLIYPKEENRYGELREAISFIDDDLNSVNLYCVHKATELTITVSVYAIGMVIINESGSGNLGDSYITIGFTPVNEKYGALVEFMVFYEIYKNSEKLTEGTFFVRNEEHIYKNLSIIDPARGGDMFEVYIEEY